MTPLDREAAEAERRVRAWLALADDREYLHHMRSLRADIRSLLADRDRVLAERDAARDLAFRAAFAPEDGSLPERGERCPPTCYVAQFTGVSDHAIPHRHVDPAATTPIWRIIGPWKTVKP